MTGGPPILVFRQQTALQAIAEDAMAATAAARDTNTSTAVKWTEIWFYGFVNIGMKGWLVREMFSQW
jgi:hypothetical protein